MVVVQVLVTPSVVHFIDTFVAYVFHVAMTMEPENTDEPRTSA